MTMMAEQVKKWMREWRKRGTQEGLEESLRKSYQRVFPEATLDGFHAFWDGFREGFEGFEEGRREGLQDFLLSEIEERFGPLPGATRRQLEEIQDYEELKALGKRLLSARSLDDLGL